tara:strand:+ start:714 stop:1700 length:987 start_codon:yes stop_codon:yes gene_type:complete
MNKTIRSFFIILIILFLVISVSFLFYSKKHKDYLKNLNLEKFENISFKTKSYDSNHIIIKLEADKKNLNKNKQILVLFKKCNSKKIFPIIDYNKLESQRIKIKPGQDKLILNAIYLKNFSFNGIILNKFNLNCVDKVLIAPNEKLIDGSFSIVRSKMKDIKKDIDFKTLEKFNFKKEDYKYTNSDVTINKDIILAKSFLIKKRSDWKNEYKQRSKRNFYSPNPGIYSKIFLKDYLIYNHKVNDLFLISKNKSEVKYINIKCKNISGRLIFLLFDPKTERILERKYCHSKEKLFFEIEDDINFNLLVSSYLNDFDPAEIYSKINISYLK